MVKALSSFKNGPKQRRDVFAGFSFLTSLP